MIGLRKQFIIFCLCMLIFSATACSTKVVKFDGDKEKVIGWNRTALAEFAITPPSLPLFPLIDAGIYRGAFYKISPQVVTLHKAKIGEITELLGGKIKEYSGDEVLFGIGLINSPEYKNIQAKNVSIFPVNIKNEKFPEIVVQDGSYNFIDFSTGSSTVFTNFSDYIKQDSVKSNIANLCKALNVDGIVIGTAGVDTIGAGLFGLNGTRLLRINLFFFDQSGNIALEGHASSEATSSSPGNIDNYTATLNEYMSYSDQLVKLIFEKTPPVDKKKEPDVANK